MVLIGLYKNNKQVFIDEQSVFLLILFLIIKKKKQIRGLGVNFSKVRSLHMDTWDLETLLVMSELGNTIVNNIYEAQIPNEIRIPTAETDA